MSKEAFLKETLREVVVKATAETEDFTYKVEYSVYNKQLTKLQCSVYTKEAQEYLGYITNESGNNQISLKEGVDIAPQVAVFNEILKEAKEKL